MSAADNDLRTRCLHDRAAGIEPAELDEINEHILNVTWLATRGSDPAYFQGSLDGWRRFYSSDGARAEHYDRLALVYDGTTLVHFSGLIKRQMQPNLLLYWAQMGMTVPEYQGSGCLARALAYLADVDWLISSPPRSYAVARTPNPIVYETFRAAAPLFPLGESTLFPRITDTGGIEPGAPESEAVAQEVAEFVSPNHRYNAHTGVIEDFLGSYGNVNRNSRFYGHDKGVNLFFEQHVREQPRDGLLVLFRLT